MDVKNFKGIKVIKQKHFEDNRGWFMESANYPKMAVAKLPPMYVQENMSFSKKGVFRGMHFQYVNWQGKLVQAIGHIIDFWVDLRINQSTFGNVGFYELKDPFTMLYIPKGFAHGFLTLEDSYFIYRCNSGYDPDGEHTLSFDGIPEIVDTIKKYELTPDVSFKDADGLSLSQVREVLTRTN